jgi:hypothetical protein
MARVLTNPKPIRDAREGEGVEVRRESTGRGMRGKRYVEELGRSQALLAVGSSKVR